MAITISSKFQAPKKRAEILEQGIYQAAKDMSSDHAPMLYGFKSSFTKKCWGMIYRDF